MASPPCGGNEQRWLPWTHRARPPTESNKVSHKIQKYSDDLTRALKTSFSETETTSVQSTTRTAPTIGTQKNRRSMTTPLTDLYANVAIHVNEDDEHRAALQLLTLVMIADYHLAASEIDEARDIVTSWRDDDFEFNDILDDAIDEALRALIDGTADDLLDDIDKSISSRVLRASLFSAARDIAEADQQVTHQENTVLAAIAARFS